MDPDDHRDKPFRRIVLPSGRTIEVLRFFRPAPQTADDARTDFTPAPAPAAPLTGASLDREPSGGAASSSRPHVCPSCDSPLVYPVAWSAAGDERWTVELRCPNCERIESALLDLDVAEHFDEQLERGAETLMSDLARLTEANMLEDLERFAAALRADAILPGDF